MRKAWIGRLHSVTGFWLVVYVGWHLWETSAATGGRERFFVRITGAGGEPWAVALEVALVLVPLALHVGLGVVRARAGLGTAGGYGDVGSRGLQWLTGGLALAFLGAHLAHTWVRKLAGAGAYGLYEGLREDLPHPIWLGVYVAGVSALCLHLAQGVGALGGAFVAEPSVRARRLWRLGGAVLALALWVVAVNTISHFATGEALIFRARPLLPDVAASSGP